MFCWQASFINLIKEDGWKKAFNSPLNPLHHPYRSTANYKPDVAKAQGSGLPDWSRSTSHAWFLLLWLEGNSAIWLCSARKHVTTVLLIVEISDSKLKCEDTDFLWMFVNLMMSPGTCCTLPRNSQHILVLVRTFHNLWWKPLAKSFYFLVCVPICWLQLILMNIVCWYEPRKEINLFYNMLKW